MHKWEREYACYIENFPGGILGYAFLWIILSTVLLLSVLSNAADSAISLPLVCFAVGVIALAGSQFTNIWRVQRGILPVLAHLPQPHHLHIPSAWLVAIFRLIAVVSFLVGLVSLIVH